MSTSNISAFLDKARSDSDLAGKISAATAEIQRSSAQVLARLSSEVGTPFTAEEFLTEQEKSLSDEALAGVAGGDFWDFLKATGTESAKTHNSLNQFPRL